ncbi:MAG: GntR family transcriptional regulator, partial [Actinomycetes bacterium]
MSTSIRSDRPQVVTTPSQPSPEPQGRLVRSKARPGLTSTGVAILGASVAVVARDKIFCGCFSFHRRPPRTLRTVRHNSASGTLADRTCAEIRAGVLTGTFEPGSPLRPAALAESLGVSPTVVRESLVR